MEHLVSSFYFVLSFTRYQRGVTESHFQLFILPISNQVHDLGDLTISNFSPLTNDLFNWFYNSTWGGMFYYSLTSNNIA